METHLKLRLLWLVCLCAVAVWGEYSNENQIKIQGPTSQVKITHFKTFEKALSERSTADQWLLYIYPMVAVLLSLTVLICIQLVIQTFILANLYFGMSARARLRHQQEHVYETTERIQTYTNDTVILDVLPPSEQRSLPDIGEPENRIQDPECEHEYITPIPDNRIQDPECEHDYITPIPENRIQDPESEHDYVTPIPENRIQESEHTYATPV